MTWKSIASGFIALGLLSSLAWAVPLPKKPIKEQVEMEGGDYQIAYQPSASAKELGLPFYPGAKVLRSRLDRATQGGKQASLLAKAHLATRDGLPAITAFYRKATGAKPEVKKVGTVEVVTFVTGTKADVRQVKISADPKMRMQEIVLTRAIKPVLPVKPKRPKLPTLPRDGSQEA